MNLLKKINLQTISPIVKAMNREIGVRGAEPRKGNWQWCSNLPSKKVLKPIVVNQHTLKQLSNTDPITWAIKTTRKSQVTQAEWDIVRDTETIELELDRWFSIIMANMNPWGFEETYHPVAISKDLYLKGSNDVKNILRDPMSPREDKKKQLKWYFESLKRKVKQDADEHAIVVKRIFERPNNDETRTFRTFLEVLIDDILTFDAGVIVKNKNFLGELAELYLIPGQDVKIYKNPDRTFPKAPEPSYVWEEQGTLRAEYTRDEIVYIMSNPQQNGYGQSPLEVAAYIITASLYADEYNIDFFKHSNVPPAIFNLGKNITTEQRNAFTAMWDNEVAGRGLHRMMFLSGSENPAYIPMQTLSSRDMQMMEYLKWTLGIKCACFQLSPQDIGLVADFHRTTAETQREITKGRGIQSLLSLLETYFNTEIVKKEFPFKDVKFQWLGLDLQDEQIQSNIDIADINNGIISRNDRRKRLGMPAVEGGDTILVNVGSQFVPIEELMPPEEDVSETEQPMGGEPTQQGLANLKAKLLGKKPTKVGQPSQPSDNSIKPIEPVAPIQPTEQQKADIVRMVVASASQDKLQKAMESLKQNGLGNNEIKISLE